MQRDESSQSKSIRRDHSPPDAHSSRDYRIVPELCSKSKPAHQSSDSSTHKGVEYVNARRYRVSDWATVEGVLRKRREIERKGLPDMTGGKFITLTLDPSLFADEKDGFESGRDRLRRFMAAARKEGLWANDCPWAWKLEFQQNGWAHWHLILLHRPKWSIAQLKRIGKLWGLGRTNVEAVRPGGFLYTFKYAFKPVKQPMTEDNGEGLEVCLPDWFLDHYQPGCETQKPQSYQRVRFWQTSKGFYTGQSPDQTEPAEPQSCIVPRPVRENAERVVNRVQIIARDSWGRYIESTVVEVSCAAACWFAAACDIFRGEAWALDERCYVTQAEKIDSKEKWKIRRIAKQNKLTPQKASRLPARRWKTC